ncbi:maleylpyruvate isomerase family mycothiol-dependent enzyme [Nocardioides coralli]|uniref:maleylpyruvate isomerase family mycothiol-dependent enzyme n=1 Tax=Nocardioides coralli TaxID=2872154 RepID=UPI001CA40436|nr:maleylpyruvate isomerase family mycothiol-dependent enzyme [Nocardioides coralli]QZY28408.1 maleylpyruvate isomerase family mycothiol-dependent enzyme [Nocardioides coralli]
MTDQVQRPIATRHVPPGHDRPRAMHEAQEAYRRFAKACAALDAEQWARPTDCTGWDVRTLAGHVLGAMRAAASMREMTSQQREIKQRVRRDGGTETDVMTAVQVDRTADLSVAELVAELRSLVGPAARGRRRTPAPLRRWATFPVEVPGLTERWTLGYLVDIVLTRDAWLHRIDLARAVGTETETTAEHDGWVVAGVAHEWLERHGQPVDLVLTGVAGGRFGDPTAEELRLDAVEFCRITSRRERRDGLLDVAVPF